MLWEILVPHSYNNKPIQVSYHKGWDAKVQEVAGGLTILRPARGRWVSPSGELLAEKMIPVRISCNEEQILEIARFTVVYYHQEAVMLYRVSDDVRIIYA